MVVPAEGDQGRGLHGAQDLPHVVAQDHLRLAEERVHGGIGRRRTKSARDSMYSGRAAYSSGVKHHGKMPR